MEKELTAECPECGSSVSFDETPLVSEIVECEECGVELEVTQIIPLKVELAPEVEEDWGE